MTAPATPTLPTAGAGLSGDGLVLEGLECGYNGLPVIRDLNLRCPGGEILSLIGPNGAGKTTTLNTIAGLLGPMSGKVRLDGEELLGLPPHRVGRRGVAFIPSDRGVFDNLTVAEHFRLARRTVGKRERSSGAMTVEDAIDLFPSLQRRRDSKAAQLSGGEQQMLAITKAVMLDPRLLLIDELSLGLAPIVLQSILPVIRKFADRTGAAVILVEQHYELALEISDRCVLLTHGDVKFSGAAAELRGQRKKVEALYLQ